MPTFAEAATTVIDQKRAGWKTPEQVQAWRGSLERYAFPRIGRRPISEVASADVLAILTPIWHTNKPVIAKTGSRDGQQRTRVAGGQRHNAVTRAAQHHEKRDS